MQRTTCNVHRAMYNSIQRTTATACNMARRVAARRSRGFRCSCATATAEPLLALRNHSRPVARFRAMRKFPCDAEVSVRRGSFHALWPAPISSGRLIGTALREGTPVARRRSNGPTPTCSGPLAIATPLQHSPPPTSAPGLGSPHAHICAGTGPTPPTSSPGLGPPPATASLLLCRTALRGRILCVFSVCGFDMHING